MNHIADANKMVSDTPRTDEAYFKNSATMYDLAGEMKQIERELNVANEKIEVLLIADCERLRIEEELNAANSEIEEKRKDVVWLATEKAKLENYVMLLEEWGDYMRSHSNNEWWCENWDKAKEAKP